MKWNVKIDFCANGGSYSKEGSTSHYFPKVRVETDRELTDGEKRRIDNEVVKAVAKTLLEIESEARHD